MIKQLLNSVIAKYRYLSVSRKSDLRLWQIIDLLATGKSRYFAQPRPTIVYYSDIWSLKAKFLSGRVGDHLFSMHSEYHPRRPRGSQSGREKREKAGRKFSSTGKRAPGYRLSPKYFQKFKRMLAPDSAQKMLCIIVPNRRAVSPEFFWCKYQTFFKITHKKNIHKGT